MKKVYLLFCFSIVQLLVSGQNKTIDFSTATGSYPNPVSSETVVQNGDSWLFSVVSPLPQIYKANYSDSHGDYLEVTGQGSPTPGTSRISIKKTDGSAFDFKSIYLYAVGSRQQILITGLRSGVAVPEYSQTYDLGPFSGAGISDVTFAPSGWIAVDEIQIRNNGTSGENGPTYANDIAFDIDDFIYAPASILPVELIGFQAALQPSGSVKVEWTTATESNNNRFEVWHSTDGNIFNLLSTLQGTGGSSLTHTYNVLDIHPFKGINYYRLVQFDRDGHRSELGTKVVNVNLNIKSRIEIYPNPSAGGTLHVNFAAKVYQQVDLVSINGSMINSQKIVENDDHVTFDMTNLSAGIYLIKLSTANGVVTKQVVKH